MNAAQPKIMLSCVSGNECIVYIEPWGKSFRLMHGEPVFFESEAVAEGSVEIGFTDDGLVVVTSDAEFGFWDSNGARVA